ncbi:hypothetical protein H4S01_006681, partial [Coemansia sp. RSA 2610]
MAPQVMAQAQQAPAPAAQGQLWKGTLHWESRQGDSMTLTHEPQCQIAAHMYPGINYSAQGLMLNEWPEQLRVTSVTSASEQFVEQCVRTGIQMVRIAIGPSAQPEHAKYFETFCTTLRENSYCAIVQFGQEASPPFPGMFLTHFRNTLVALPFVKHHITDAIINALSQFSTSAAVTTPALAQATVGSANPAVSQMTPQQSAAGLPISGLGNVSLVNRTTPMSAPGASAAAQQIMSPQQAYAARPNIASPVMGNAAPTNIQLALAALQRTYGSEQMEMIKNLPQPQRDMIFGKMIAQIRNQQ